MSKNICLGNVPVNDVSIEQNNTELKKHTIIDQTVTFCAKFQKEFSIHEWQSLDTHPPTHCRLLQSVLFHFE